MAVVVDGFPREQALQLLAERTSGALAAGPLGLVLIRRRAAADRSACDEVARQEDGRRGGPTACSGTVHRTGDKGAVG